MKFKTRNLLLLSLVPCLLTISGCSSATSAPSPEGLKFLLKSEPDGSADVIAARDEVKDQDKVIIVGRIGGSENPWVKGRAAFTIVDSSLKSCHEVGDDKCPKPWDYC